MRGTASHICSADTHAQLCIATHNAPQMQCLRRLHATATGANRSEARTRFVGVNARRFVVDERLDGNGAGVMRRTLSQPHHNSVQQLRYDGM